MEQIKYKDIYSLVGNCKIIDKGYGVIHIEIKQNNKSDLLALFDYFYENASVTYTITTNYDSELSYYDFTKYRQLKDLRI